MNKITLTFYDSQPVLFFVGSDFYVATTPLLQCINVISIVLIEKIDTHSFLRMCKLYGCIKLGA